MNKLIWLNDYLTPLMLQFGVPIGWGFAQMPDSNGSIGLTFILLIVIFGKWALKKAAWKISKSSDEATVDSNLKIYHGIVMVLIGGLVYLIGAILGDVGLTFIIVGSSWGGSEIYNRTLTTKYKT